MVQGQDSGLLPQWGMGLIPGQGTRIPQAVWCGQKKKRKKERKRERRKRQRKGGKNQTTHLVILKFIYSRGCIILV